MALYFLDYDVLQGHDYQRLYAELARFRAIHILDSLWCFERLNTNCPNLRDHFAQFLHPDDRLVVSEVIHWAMRNHLGHPRIATRT